MLTILPQLQQYLDAKRWVVAYSGGVDSHVLLHQLAALSVESNTPPVCAIHINHGLQAAADHWQQHCESICDHLNVDCTSIVVNVDGKGGLEQSARDARYGAFEQYLQAGDVLFQGHHLDDQAETVLMRLLNGSGPKGLAGIPAQRIVGSVMAGYEGHRGWINYLAIAPEYQRQGLGRDLMVRAEEALAAIGCPKINLQVRSQNAKVIAFYEAIGYLVEDRVSLGKRHGS